jgi:hypothetical protein
MGEDVYFEVNPEATEYYAYFIEIVQGDHKALVFSDGNEEDLAWARRIAESLGGTVVEASDG